MKSHVYRIPLALFTGLMLFCAGLYAFSQIDSATGAEARSVEIGLAEVSPNGKEGGYAVPASGSSAPLQPQEFSLHLSDKKITQGERVNVRWKWSNAVYGVKKVTVTRCRDAGKKASNCNAWVDVTEKDGSDFGGEVETFSCFFFLTCNDASKKSDGTSPWYNARSTSLAPGKYVYRGEVRFKTGYPEKVTDTVTLNVKAPPVPPPPALPDLTATMQSGGSLKQGNSAQFTGTVRNAGNASTGRSFANRFEYRWGTGGSWASMGNVNAGTLGAGAPASLKSANFSLNRSGTLQVRLCADISNTIGESNNANNCSGPAQFAVAATIINLYPNLTRSPSGTITEGDKVTFTGRIHNGGTSAAVASNARMCLDNSSCLNNTQGRIGSEQAIPALGAGAASGTFTRTWTATAGTHTVRLCADTGKSVTESNEGDNCNGSGGTVGTITFTVNAKPKANPQATLQVRNITPGFETQYTPASATTFQIVAGHNIELKWLGTDSDSCRGVNFNTNDSTNGLTSNVTEPALGTAETYEVICSKSGVEDRATMEVTAVAALPTLKVSKNPVLTEEPFTLEWNLNGNDPAQCTISGPGAEAYDSTGDITTQTGTTNEIEAVGTATYKLDCAAGDDEVQLNVLPQVYES